MATESPFPAEAFVHLDVRSCYSLYASPSTPEDYAETLADQLLRSSGEGRPARRNGRPVRTGARPGVPGTNGTTPAPEPADAGAFDGDGDPEPPEAPRRAIALADYGLHSAVKMARACRKHGLEHLVGLRVRVVPARAFRTWTERPGELLLLAADDEGWLNLVALNNLGHVAGWHGGAPRVDWQDLAGHAGGLLCLTGSPGSGLLAPALERTGDPLRDGEALRLAERLAALFPGRLYVELAYHGHAAERLVGRGLVQLAERLELPTVATNAVRYARPDQALAQLVFAAMGRGRRAAGTAEGPGASGGAGGWGSWGGARGIGDLSSVVIDGARGQGYLKSGREMARLFGHRPAALAATQEIARRCRFRLPLAEEIPADQPDRRYGPRRFFGVGAASEAGARRALASVAADGLAYRHRAAKGSDPTEGLRAALAAEVQLLGDAGLAELLLTAHQVGGACAERGIPLAARGSATSSLVAWALGLVEVFPPDYGLRSETFVYAGRPDRPDLDLEVASAYEQVVKGLVQAAGRGEGRPQPAADADGLPFVRALRLGTHVAFGSRLAVRQVGTALGLNDAKTNVLARQVPIRATPGAIEDAFAQPHELGAPDVAPHAEPWTTVLDLAGRLESLPQRHGVHPTGFTFAFDFAEPRRAGTAGRPPGDPAQPADPEATPGALRWLPVHWVGSAGPRSTRGLTLPRHVAVVAAEAANALSGVDGPGFGGLSHPAAGPPATLRSAEPAPAERHEEDPGGAEAPGQADSAARDDLALAQRDADGQPALVCQWDKDDLDALGLVKLDVSLSAALTTLPSLSAAAAGAPVDSADDADPVAALARRAAEDAAWTLLLNGDTLCIAQVETWGMRKLLRRARDACFEHDTTGNARALNTLEDLAQLLALSKPGARGADPDRQEAYFGAKYGVTRPAYAHPAMAAVLDQTGGQVLYSEQLTDLLKLVGVPHATAERFRRLLNSADFLARDALELELRAAAEVKGWTKEQVNALLGAVLTHQGYLHNHGHALAYAYRVFEQARLKANPGTAAAFYCEVLNTGGSLQYGLGTAAEEARRKCVVLLPPCVNRSQDRFVAETGRTDDGQDLPPAGAVRFPLVAVRGLPAEAAQHVLAVREAFGPYTSLVDFCRRVDRRIVTRAHLQVLIRLGAFGFTGLSRAKLFVAEPFCAAGADLLRLSGPEGDRATALQEALAEGATAHLAVEEWDPAVVAAYDLAYLGCYVAAPLETQKFGARLKEEFGAIPVAELRDFAHGDRVAVGGIVIAYRVRTTRRAQQMAWLTLTDGTGAVRCGIWPSVFEQMGPRLALREGTFIVGVGKCSQDETDGTMLFLDEVHILGTREARLSALAVSVERRRTDASAAAWMRQ